MPDDDLIGKALLWIAIVMIASGVISGCQQPRRSASEQRPDDLEPGRHPQLVIDESVAPDFEALAMATWDQFLVAFQGRSDCFGDVRLRAARVLDSRASYDPGTATVTVRVPGTPAMLQSGLIHEWAHHVEFQCEEQQELRPAFLAAQDLPPDTPWRPDILPAQTSTSRWAETPSEQYAEATIVLVLGSRPIPTKVRVTKESVRVIAAWAAGDGSYRSSGEAH